MRDMFLYAIDESNDRQTVHMKDYFDAWFRKMMKSGLEDPWTMLRHSRPMGQNSAVDAFHFELYLMLFYLSQFSYKLRNLLTRIWFGDLAFDLVTLNLIRWPWIWFVDLEFDFMTLNVFP